MKNTKVNVAYLCSAGVVYSEQMCRVEIYHILWRRKPELPAPAGHKPEVRTTGHWWAGAEAGRMVVEREQISTKTTVQKSRVKGRQQQTSLTHPPTAEQRPQVSLVQCICMAAPVLSFIVFVTHFENVNFYPFYPDQQLIYLTAVYCNDVNIVKYPYTAHSFVTSRWTSSLSR